MCWRYLQVNSDRGYLFFVRLTCLFCFFSSFFFSSKMTTNNLSLSCSPFFIFNTLISPIVKLYILICWYLPDFSSWYFNILNIPKYFALDRVWSRRQLEPRSDCISIFSFFSIYILLLSNLKCMCSWHTHGKELNKQPSPLPLFLTYTNVKYRILVMEYYY